MTDDPAFDWDCYDARGRQRRIRWAKSHTCEQCDFWESPPEGAWGWCRQFEFFEREDHPCMRCDFWND